MSVVALRVYRFKWITVKKPKVSPPRPKVRCIAITQILVAQTRCIMEGVQIANDGYHYKAVHQKYIILQNIFFNTNNSLNV